MSGMVDLYMVYRFIRKLTTPFDKWDAYDEGIIDERGNILKKRKELRTQNEKKAFTTYDLLILNIKKMLQKVPGGNSKLGSYAAALFLIRESNIFSPENTLNEETISESVLDSFPSFFSDISDYIQEQESVNPKNDDINEMFENYFLEDAPTVSAGSGAVAGIGVGPDGEPGLTKAQQKKHRERASKTTKKLRKILGEE